MPRRLSTRDRATRTALTVLTVLTALTGCTQGERPGESAPSASPTVSPSASPSASPSTTSRPSGLPKAFDPAGTTLPDVGVVKAVVTEDRVLTLTPSRLTAYSLPDLETAYRVPLRGALLSDLRVDRASGTVVLVGTSSSSAEGTGAGADLLVVVRIDPDSGEVVDRSQVTVPPTTARVSAPIPSARVAGVVDDIVVVDTWSSIGSDQLSVTAARHTLVAVDLGTDAVAWRQRPARPIVQVPASADRATMVLLSTGEPGREGRLEAREVATGDLVWKAVPGLRTATPLGLLEDRAALAVTAGQDRVVTLDLASGAEVASRPAKTWNWSCYPTNTEVALCTVVGLGRVVGWDLEKAAPRWRLPTPTRFAPSITAVVHTRAYGVVQGATGVVIDARTGEDLLSDTGGAPTSVGVWGGVSVLGGEAIFQPALR